MSGASPTPNSDVPKHKSVTIAFQEAKIATPSANLLTLFESNSAARSDSSNQWIIDVFPNMVPILMYVMLTALGHANKIDHRDHAKASVATICMYYMTVVYGFFLLNDLYVRPAMSAHARSWKEISWKEDFVSFLLTLPVPEFLVSVLQQFKSFTTDRTKNVFFIPSAAGYDHDIFFGRIFPLNMFAAIHDCTATLPGNSTRMQVLQDLYSRVLYTITQPGFKCLIPDLIGISIDQTTATTANYMNSKLYQVFSAVFNPVLFRDFQRRTSLAALSFQAPIFATNHINAYDVLFSATSANVRELKVVLQAVSALLADTTKATMTLCQVINDTSGNAIIKHGYSTYALPTWIHGENANKPNLFKAIDTQHHVTYEERAQDISFLQRPTAAVAATHLAKDVIFATSTEPETPVALPANHQITRFLPFNLVCRTDQDHPFPRHDNEDLVKFDENIHATPSVLVLDTDGDLTVTAHLATLTGKIIESFELDGSTIEMPNASKSLGLQNCMFADSAIPYKYVVPGTVICARAANSVPTVLNRAPPNNRPRLPASSFLYDRTIVMLPRYNQHIVEEHVLHLPGFTVKQPVNQVTYGQSFIGFRTDDSTDNAQAIDDVPGMKQSRVILWSPFSYTAYESDEYPSPDLSASRHYFLCNLRTIFGTDYNLVKVKHPYEAMPVV